MARHWPQVSHQSLGFVVESGSFLACDKSLYTKGLASRLDGLAPLLQLAALELLLCTCRSLLGHDLATLALHKVRCLQSSRGFALPALEYCRLRQLAFRDLAHFHRLFRIHCLGRFPH